MIRATVCTVALVAIGLVFSAVRTALNTERAYDVAGYWRE